MRLFKAFEISKWRQPPAAGTLLVTVVTYFSFVNVMRTLLVVAGT